MKAQRSETLTNDEIAVASLDDLRAAYHMLRDRYIRETIDLVIRIDRMRPVYASALDWRQHVTLVPSQQHTARLIAVIDTALAVEAKD